MDRVKPSFRYLLYHDSPESQHQNAVSHGFFTGIKQIQPQELESETKKTDWNQEKDRFLLGPGNRKKPFGRKNGKILEIDGSVMVKIAFQRPAAATGIGSSSMSPHIDPGSIGHRFP